MGRPSRVSSDAGLGRQLLLSSAPEPLPPMPTLTRWSIKAALLWLVAATVVGIVASTPAALGLPAALTGLAPLYVHFLTLGWLTQLIFGVVFWLFPMYSKVRPHRSVRLGWTVFALLNGGMVLRALAEGTQPVAGVAPPPWLFVLAALALWLAGLGFVINTWGRVKVR